MLSRLAPAAAQPQAQAWLAAAWAGLMAILTALCGQVYASWGEHIYLAMAAVAAAGLALLWAAIAQQSTFEPPLECEVVQD